MIEFGEKLDNDRILLLLSKAVPGYLASYNQDDSGLFGATSPTTFNMGTVGSSSPVIEYVLRPHLQICCILSAYIYRNTPASPSLCREDIAAKIVKGISWACKTHLTGTLDIPEFLSRKRWGENWRSGLWASQLAIAAYFTKDFIDQPLSDRVNAVVAFEADRFIDVLPPSGCEFDTKLEENAQDAVILSWAVNLMPDHPHILQWEKALAIWSLNIATTPEDRADHTRHLNRSVAHWTSTQTLYSDMTAENHGYFNPEILTYGMWVVLAMAAYRLHGRKVPEFLQRRNHEETFETLLRFCLPNGLLFSPSNTDFPLHIPRPLSLAWGLWNNDPRAQRLTVCLLNWMAEHLTADDIPDTDPVWVRGLEGSPDGWALQFQSMVGFELAMLATLPFPEEHRFYSMGQIENAVDTRKIYPYVQLCYRRNTQSSRSVAWKAHARHPAIGIAVHGFPELLAPVNANLLGIPVIETGIKSWEVAYHYDNLKKQGFDTFGRVVYYDNAGEMALHRDFRVLTWGDDGLVVFDRIFAHKEILFPEQYLSPLHLVNDHWTGNKLELCSGSLRETIRHRQPKRPISCPSFWASVENHLLVQFIWGRNKGLTYIPGGARNHPRYWNNACLDSLAVQVEARHCRPGDIAYEAGMFIGTGKSPRAFKSAGHCGEFFRGLVIMDGRNTAGLD